MLERVFRKSTLFDVLLIIVASVAIVGFWRGFWNLMDKYVFPGNFLGSNLTTIIGGIVLLVLLSRMEDKEKIKLAIKCITRCIILDLFSGLRKPHSYKA
jgi:hypothetical protein